MIKLENITKTYDGKAQVHALKGVNLTIEDGEIFGIIGKSGAGKSTLVRCINMLERPTSGNVIIEISKGFSAEGRHILIAEDIIDTGHTLKAVKERLYELGALSVETCCILNKPARRQTEITADYVGFDIPDEFVVGYGLDYAGKYRNLPYIGVLSRKVYE